VKKYLVALSLFIMPSTLLAQNADPSLPTIYRIDNIPYESQSTLFGNLKVVVLFGDPSKDGPYVQRIKFPPNMKIAPHAHGVHELKIVSLLGGELHFGYLGDKGEAMKVGNIWTESMGLVHWGLAGPEGAVIEIHGIGPVNSIPYKKD
jgi:quercetin dioxygenase-like cupin family protein